MKQKKSKDRIEKESYSSGKKVQELENKLKNAEEVIHGLKNEKQWIERITSISPSIITVYDCKKKKNTFQNRSLMELLGYSKKEIEKFIKSKQAIRNNLIHPEDVKKVDESFYEIDNMKDGKTYNVEYRLKDSKGNWQWIRKSSKVLKRDDKGKPIEIISSYDIITDLKEKESEIEIIKNDNEYIMTVSDNGTGIPDNIDYRNTQSLGMQLVMTLVEQITGSIKLDKKTGAKFIIAFPVNA